MTLNYFFSFLILLSVNVALFSTSISFFSKINEDGTKETLDELINRKYVAHPGDNFNVDIASLFELENYDEIFRSVFKLGINVNTEISYGKDELYRFLDLAIVQKNEKIASFLIENGADVNAVNSAGLTPLMHAVIGKFKEGISLLIKHGANINTKYCRVTTLLDFAFGQDGTDILELLIQHGAKIDERDVHGNRALNSAVYHNNENAVKVLIDHGLDITKEVEALKFAIINLNKSMVELLISKGIDLNTKDEIGDVSLATALRIFDPHCYVPDRPEMNEVNKIKIREIVALLLQKGANPNCKCSNNYSLLKMAEELDQEVYNLLLNHGASEYIYEYEDDNSMLELFDELAAKK